MSNTPSLKLEAFPFKVVLWEHINDKGYPYYSGNLEKLEKDKGTGKWATVKINIQGRDLPTLAAIVQAAFIKVGVTEDRRSDEEESRKQIEADVKEAF